MYGLIFSGVFLFFAALFVLVGALRGKKTAWQLSVTRIVLSLITAVLAAFISALVSWYVAGALFDLVMGMIDLDIDELIKDLPVARDVGTALIAMIIAPLIYLLLYAILRPIMIAFTKLIARPFKKLTTKRAPAVVAHSDEPEQPEDAYDPEKDYTSKYETDASAEDYDITAKYMNQYEAQTEQPKVEKKDKKREFKLEKNNWVGALCGALCSLVTFCILLVPMVGFLDVASDVMSVTASSDEGEETVLGMVADIVDGAANNAGSVTVKAIGGGLLYDMMTTYTVDGVDATLRAETGFLSSAANAALLMVDENSENKEKVDGIRDVSDAFDDADLLPMLVADVTAAASDDWKNGRDFHGIELPSMGATTDPLVMSLVEAFSHSGRGTIKEDFGTIVEILAVLTEKNAFDDISKNPLAMLSKEDTTSEILLNLLNNKRLGVMVDGVSDFGVAILLSAVKVNEEVEPEYEKLRGALTAVSGDNEEELASAYISAFDRYGIKITEEQGIAAAQAKLSGTSILKWTEENVVKDKADFVKKTELISIEMITDGTATVKDKKTESKVLARAYAQAYELMDKMSSSSFGIKDMVGEMGGVLDTFALSESIGPEKTAYILKAMLQSETVHDEIGFSVLEASNSADSISKNAAKKSYAEMLNSLMLAVDMVEAASDVNVNTAEAVEKMLNDLTPESAEVLKTITTPEVVKNYGVPEKSSKPTSELMGNTFENLANAKEEGMSDEDYAKESSAVTNMMSVVMTSGKGAIFGERSATGTTAQQFVDDIMDSTVMADTLVDEVYGEGDEPALDPLVSNRTMAQEESDSFIEALNNRWNASDKSEETKKEITAIASIMNVHVEVTESGVQKVAVAQ